MAFASHVYSPFVLVGESRGILESQKKVMRRKVDKRFEIAPVRKGISHRG